MNQIYFMYNPMDMWIGIVQVSLNWVFRFSYSAFLVPYNRVKKLKKIKTISISEQNKTTTREKK